MSKIFDWDGRKGTLIDSVSKTAGTLTVGNGGFKRTEKGLALLLDGSTTDIDSGVTLSGVKTIAIYIKPSDNTKILLDNGSDKLEISGGNYSGTGLTQNYVNNTDTDSYNQNQWQLSVSEFSAGIAFSTDLEITPDASTYIARIICFDSILTTQERNNLYTEFLNSYAKHEHKTLYYPPPQDLSRELGLVAAYNIVPQNGFVVDISANGNNGTISGALSSLSGMKFDGVGDNMTIGNIGNVKSIAFRIKLKTTTEQILEGAANDKLILANAGTLTYADYDNAYIDGVDTNTIVAGQWTNVVITSSTNVDNSATTLALNNAAYGAFEIEDLRFYSTELTLQDAKDYHNSFAKQVSLKESFKDTGADGTSVVPREWIPGTGTYKVEELSAQDSVIKHLDIGTHYLENTSAGIIAHQSKQAYGIWEFDVYKGADANRTAIHFMADRIGIISANQGYYILMTAAEEFKLIKNDIGSPADLFETAVSYIDSDTWYRIKITRTLAGVFTVYIRGGAFGDDDWTTVSVAGGSGTNPVTDNTYATSNFMVLDSDDDDRITNIILKKGVKQ